MGRHPFDRKQWLGGVKGPASFFWSWALYRLSRKASEVNLMMRPNARPDQSSAVTLDVTRLEPLINPSPLFFTIGRRRSYGSRTLGSSWLGTYNRAADSFPSLRQP